MSIILTEEEYRALQFKPCDKCSALKQRFDDAGTELIQLIINELSDLPEHRDKATRISQACLKFSRTL